MKDLLLRFSVVVRTLNMKISRRRLADYVKKLHHEAYSTWNAIIFTHSTNQVIALWRCRRRCRRHYFNSLLFQLLLRSLITVSGKVQGLPLKRDPCNGIKKIHKNVV